MHHEQCKIQKAKCKMQNTKAQCTIQNAQCKIQNAQCTMLNAKCKMEKHNAKCKMEKHNAKFQIPNAKFNVHNAQFQIPNAYISPKFSNRISAKNFKLISSKCPNGFFQNFHKDFPKIFHTYFCKKNSNIFLKKISIGFP